VRAAASAAQLQPTRRCRKPAPVKRCITSGEDFMSTLITFVKSFVREEEGQDLLEYALLVALIALVAIGAVGAAGTSVSGIFSNIAGQLANAA
jgi:pilus assembly protein Flp/PilA